jgi:hypothetical protein
LSEHASVEAHALLESFCVPEDVAVSRDKPAYLSGSRIVAVPLRVANITAVDVNACCWFPRDIVDSMNATVA